MYLFESGCRLTRRSFLYAFRRSANSRIIAKPIDLRLEISEGRSIHWQQAPAAHKHTSRVING